MNIKFSDIVKSARKSCDKCLTFKYMVPCEVDKGIASFLKDFGDPDYNLDVVKFLEINSADGHKIKTKVGSIYVKFGVPKELENNINKSRKKEFEKNIANWIENKLDIKIKL
jgi:hypothetical protein